MLKRKRHFCGECKKWYADSSSFSSHLKRHGLPKGILPKGSRTPLTSSKLNYPFICKCGKLFRKKT